MTNENMVTLINTGANEVIYFKKENMYKVILNKSTHCAFKDINTNALLTLSNENLNYILEQNVKYAFAKENNFFCKVFYYTTEDLFNASVIELKEVIKTKNNEISILKNFKQNLESIYNYCSDYKKYSHILEKFLKF